VFQKSILKTEVAGSYEMLFQIPKHRNLDINITTKAVSIRQDSDVLTLKE